jgi:hypothetical protein
VFGPNTEPSPRAIDEPDARWWRWWDVAVVGPCVGTTAVLAFGASTETAGSVEFGVGCDSAVPDVLHSKIVDKVTTTDGTAKPKDDRIVYLHKSTEMLFRQP